MMIEAVRRTLVLGGVEIVNNDCGDRNDDDNNYICVTVYSDSISSMI